MTEGDDASRFAVIDALRVRPLIGRYSDKRTDEGRKRYLRAVTHHNLMLAACGCTGQPLGKPGGICLKCQGAVLTGEERKK